MQISGQSREFLVCEDQCDGSFMNIYCVRIYHFFIYYTYIINIYVNMSIYIYYIYIYIIYLYIYIYILYIYIIYIYYEGVLGVPFHNKSSSARVHLYYCLSDKYVIKVATLLFVFLLFNIECSITLKERAIYK